MTIHSPRESGFIQLSNTRSRSEMGDDIPLSTLKSHASSNGTRRPDQTNVHLSDESDAGDEKNYGGRRKLLPSRRGTVDSDDVSMNWLGRIYAKIIGFNASLRYLIYIVPVGIALAVPLVVLATTGRKHTNPVGSKTKTRGDDDEEYTVDGPPLFKVFLWVEIAWLTIWAGKLVAYFLPLIFMFLCGIISSGTRKYGTVLKNLTIPLSLFFWALASFITFRELFKPSKKDDITWVRNFERVLGASFVSSAVYLVEKAIVQLIGISYHQRSFANRIKSSKDNIRLLAHLLEASRALFPMYCSEFEEEDYIINNSLYARLPGKPKAGPAGVPRRLAGNVGRISDKVTSIVGNLASEITGKKVLNPNSAHSIVTDALEEVTSSEALGKRIWMTFAVEDRDGLYLDDLNEVLGPANAAEAKRAFDMLDEDENGDVSLDEMVRKVVSIGRERKLIIEGMKDISQALQAFDKVLLFLVLLIVIFIFLAFFQSSFITTLATAGTALLSLSFVFAVTTQEFLGSCIFLFVKHPYDVGDRIEMMVDGIKVALLVERISLLYSVFVRCDKMQIVQMPNIKLNDIWIENVTRSGAMFQVFNINVSYDYTTNEDIDLLRHELEKFVRHPDNSRDFEPEIYLWVVSLGDLDKMQLQMLIWHRSNWHDGILTGDRNSKFIVAVADALRRIPIYAPRRGDFIGTASNPAYMVNFTDDAAAGKYSDMEKHREAFRNVPTGPPATMPEGPAVATTEAAAAPDGVTGVPVADDWFSRHNMPGPPVTIPEESTGVSLEPLPSQSSSIPQRGESKGCHKNGLRKKGETLSNSVARPGGVNRPESENEPRASSSVRSRAGYGYDEEAQMGSPVSPAQGGFLAPSASQRSMVPAAAEAEMYQGPMGPQHSARRQRRGPREPSKADGVPHPGGPDSGVGGG